MESWRSTTFWWALIIMSPSPWPKSFNVACIWASIADWGAMPHNWSLSRTVSCDELVLPALFSKNFKFSVVSVLLVGAGFELQIWTLLLVGNILRMPRLINVLPCHSWTVIYSTFPTHGDICICQIRTSWGNMPSTLTTLKFAVKLVMIWFAWRTPSKLGEEVLFPQARSRSYMQYFCHRELSIQCNMNRNA